AALARWRRTPDDTTVQTLCPPTRRPLPSAGLHDRRTPVLGRGQPVAQAPGHRWPQAKTDDRPGSGPAHSSILFRRTQTMTKPGNQLPDAEQLLQRLAALLQPAISQDTALVGIHSGGVWIMERLLPMLGANLEHGRLDVSFYRDDFGQRGLHHDTQPSE